MRALTCSICTLPLFLNEKHYTGEIDAVAASRLLDTDKPELVPTWEQLPTGMLRLTFCEACGCALGCEDLLVRHDPNPVLTLNRFMQ